ncbi:FHA domain-containing protein [Blastococcus sp. TML/M2B]|uniref:FtsK/SpoIIIE domain-containing protein n=1 Tax=unclassified Blastococcus TaxID=2619396 RepID=UPI00190C75D7|nr:MULTISPECIES: FtsK/SpoIIIE domain-containing protein [unclassified Blastococcus]MBN1093775.1 FHA domain-containing protein [Blastococcus sp. TML/M2B]MBN1096102.1 FHA domain-containing protein [Blastococcus sp. TML/C7B]
MSTLPAGPPPLRTPRCWTVRGAEGAVDVEVGAGDDACVADVLPLLRRVLGVPVAGLWAGAAPLEACLPLSSPLLRHGAVLSVAGPVPPPASTTAPLELRVLGGPDAGRAQALGRGVHVVGRDAGCDVRVADPDISRHHVEVRVGDGEVEVRDLGSTNGSVLDASRLDDRFTRWPPAARLRLGASTLAICTAADSPAVVEPAGGGRTRLRPPHRLRPVREEREVVLPRPPAETPPRRLAWVAVLLPAVGGVLLAWFLRTPTFLFFALLSPLVALGTWASERWSGRRTGRRDRAAHRADLAEAHRRVADAVADDVRAAEQEHPDPATIAAAVRRRTDLLWSRRPAGGGPLVVRVGTGPGPVQVTRVEQDGHRERAVADTLPVPVDLSATGGLAVLGPRAEALGALRAVLCSLVALHPPDALRLQLLTDADRLADWSWARWLPHLPTAAVHVVPGSGAADGDGDAPLRAWAAGLAAEPAAPGAGHLVVVVDRRIDGRTAELLRAARAAGLLVLTTAERPGELPVAADAALTLSGETASSGVLARDGSADRPAVLVDRISVEVAARLARGLADLEPAGSGSALPTEVRLLDLPGWAVRPAPDGAAVGRWPQARDTLRTDLGNTSDGPASIDLCRDGPHALVAGTTGSGKSELLQSLIAGLALNHPPERCSFLLVDYKGGAAFAEAARLPHTVGLLTDLDGSTTARALRSLAAELSRREALLAAHGVPDLAALPASVELARLVIVVDEFATLVEELPGFVPGLVGIAQRGRSLGIHLVLATQRPGGVVSPEIRANCTLRICLRTTDEADSRDVVGTPAAAHLPVDLPGRAVLRTGNAPPRLLQVARVAVPDRSAPPAPEVRRWSWPLHGAPSRPAAGGGDTDLVRLVDALSRAAALRAGPGPHRPWQPPLPDRLAAEELDRAAPAGAGDGEQPARLRIGLVDRPDQQARLPLELDLTVGGGVLAVGGPRSGRTTFLRSVLRSATARLGPGELHVHVLDAGGGGLGAEAATLPHTGTAVGSTDILRAVRLVDRLNREVDARRAAPGDPTAPLVLLLVDGLEAVGALLDDADPGRGSDALLRLVRDGAAVGLTCVLTGDRAVPGGRLASAARMRLVLPLPDRADYAVAGVPARSVPAHRPPGRALCGEDAEECQLALPRTPDPRAEPAPGSATAPVRVVELPADPVLPVGPAAHAAARGAGRWRVPVGPGGDGGEVLGVDLGRSGGLLVVGGPGTGRTAALHALAHRLAAGGAEVGWWAPAGPGGPEGLPGTALDPADPGALRAWVDALDGRPGVLVADDLGAGPECAGLTTVPPTGARSGVVVLAAGSAAQLSSHYQGPVAALRRARTGLLLGAGPADAELLGIRLPRLPLPARPGSGWLVRDGVAERVQVARVQVARVRVA